MKKEAQTVIEYILIFILVAVFAFTFVSNFDFKGLRNHIFMRPVESTDSTKIKIEPMTYGDEK